MPTLEAESIDAIVCDPPYGLGFMGKAWDHGVPGVPFWSAALRVARPGSHLLAFGGTRTYHRLTSAIEDAGWEIRDCLSWLYGSGFPKHSSALKPAWEPIILARRPAPRATPLNIDGCRIAEQAAQWGEPKPTTADDASGRWPANVCLDEDAAALLDAQSGELKGAASYVRKTDATKSLYGQARRDAGSVMTGYGDVGGASRFLYTAKASRRERGEGNDHPTVKPLALMRWLCRLVTPKGGSILDPFCGSGTTGRAAVAEGFSFIGIELSEEYAAIARARIAEYAPLFADGAA